MEEQDNFHFLLLAAFSLAASILKYSSTSSTGVSSFFTPGALFLAGSLQGSKGPSLFGFGFKKGSIRFVSLGGTTVYGTQSEILICGNDTFFLLETVFIT